MELQVFDPVQPFENALQSRKNIRNEALQNEALQMERTKFQNALQDREFKNQMNILSQNEELNKAGLQILSTVDPDSPDFENQLHNGLVQYTNLMHRARVPPQYIDQYVTQFFKSGMANPEAIRNLQVQMKLRPKGLEQTYNEAFTKSAATEAAKRQQFNEPYLDKDTGALLQKNETTGKVEKIAAPPKGWVIESDGQGGFRMVMGATGSQLTPKTKAALEEKQLGYQEAYSRISAINNEFKPEYQELGSRLANAWTGFKAKLGAGISKEDAAKLTEFKAYQRKAIENINLYIKEITGAQMSEKEADRLRLAQPDPGEKWWQGDDPITFKAKLEDIQKYTRAAIARYNYYKSQGLDDNKITELLKSGKAITLESLVSEMK